MKDLNGRRTFLKGFVQTACAVFVVLFFVQYCYPQGAVLP